jgi:hypothetical protein
MPIYFGAFAPFALFWDGKITSQNVIHYIKIYIHTRLWHIGNGKQKILRGGGGRVKVLGKDNLKLFNIKSQKTYKEEKAKDCTLTTQIWVLIFIQ